MEKLGIRPLQPAFEVVACIDGRGFGVRREDMRNLLLITEGKVLRVLNSGEHEPSDDPMARKQLSCLSIPRHCRVAHVDHGVLDIRVP